MSTATEIRPRAEWLAEARRELRLARALRAESAGYVNGAWLNAVPFERALERARICRTLARNPGRTYLDVFAEAS